MKTFGKIRTLQFAVAIALLAYTHAAENEKSKLKENSPTPLDPREKFLFGSFSTTTYTQVVASTSTVFFSCLSGTATGTVCQGRGARRNKKLKRPDITVVESEVKEDIESSITDDVVNQQDMVRNSKLGFTIWTTSRTTTSVTVFFTNTSTTLRLSYYCFAGGIQFPQFNCQLG
ncbi:hypothetical protein SK128_016679 [Halocaridina rubra]|uniref:Uncharacterized protein n=1 Tax=Halocaridina rubra TaxID=373956 RepID=A0AAN9A8N2_HALRR